MSDSIAKKVVQGLGQIVTETAEKSVEHIGEIGSSIISGQELLGINVKSDEELKKMQAEDERKKQEEMDKIRQQMREPGRNVEAEMKQVAREIEEAEEQKRKEEQQQQRPQDESSVPLNMESANPQKRKKKRGSALGGGKKKTNLPDPASMSQTSEKAGKME